MRMTEEQAYELMCMDCPNANRCHEECEVCDEFLEATDPDAPKYQCVECGHKFNEPSSYEEKRDWWGGWCYEEILCCPVCKGGYIEL